MKNVIVILQNLKYTNNECTKAFRGIKMPKHIMLNRKDIVIIRSY